jgi:hypothetical protein
MAIENGSRGDEAQRRLGHEPRGRGLSNACHRTYLLGHALVAERPGSVCKIRPLIPGGDPTDGVQGPR